MGTSSAWFHAGRQLGGLRSAVQQACAAAASYACFAAAWLKEAIWVYIIRSTDCPFVATCPLQGKTSFR